MKTVTYLPSVGYWYAANVEVRATGENAETYRLLNFSPGAHIDYVDAGLDADNRPSFLTVEQAGESPNWGAGLYWFSAAVEDRVNKMSLEQSENFVEDIERECYVAQWSLVTPPRRKGRRRTPALYELTSTYDLCRYRSEGNFHVALGDRRSTLVPQD